MRWSEAWTTGLLPGGDSRPSWWRGFGLAMLEIGLLPTIAQLIRIDSSAAGFIVHMAAASIIGAGFGLLVWRQRPGAGETLFWGLAYGAFWWYLGPLTLLPIMTGGGPTWDVGSAQEALPALPGHVLFGTSMGLAIVFFRWTRSVQFELT